MAAGNRITKNTLTKQISAANIPIKFKLKKEAKNPSPSSGKKTPSPSSAKKSAAKKTPAETPSPSSKHMPPTNLFIPPKVPASSPYKLEIMYNTICQDNRQMKAKMKEFFDRIKSACGDDYLTDILIGQNPLLKLYDLVLAISSEKGHRDDEGSSKPISVVVISDSTVGYHI